MVDAADILALAPVADTVAVDALVRSIRPRQRLLAAAVCRGGHLHVLTSKELWVASGGTAHVEASKDQLGGAVTMAGEGGEGGGVDVAILAFSGVEPAHPFPAAEGLALARAINELVGQPPDGPVVTPLGRGRIKRRPSSWRSLTLLRAGDSCDVTVVPHGVQLYFSSGDYPMSTVLARNELRGILDATTTVLVFESRGEPLEIELDAEADDVLAAIPGARNLAQRPDLPGDRRQVPSVGEAAARPTDDADDGAPGRLDGANRTGPREDSARRSDAPIVTRDGTVIERVLVAVGEAESKWAELVRSSGTSGRWPVIVTTRSFAGYDELGRFVDEASSDRAASAPDLLAASVALDPEEVLRRRWEGSVPIEGEDAESFEVLDESLPVDPVRLIPARPAPQGTTTIVLIPTASEDVPAVLGWGNWNACPRPDEHVAVLRRWRTRYGAELKAMSNDSLEFVVSRPPGTFEEALVLAREQYAYAPDIVDQGEHATIGTLAAALVNSRHWHFWWD